VLITTGFACTLILYCVATKELQPGDSTTLFITSNENQQGYSFISIPFHINICSFNLDIDGDGVISSLTDGLLILRYLFNFSSGDSLIKDAISMNATRTTDIEIQQFINRGLNYLDIDGNSTIDALSDGLLIIRYLYDLKSDAGLINNAIGKNAIRLTSDEISTYIDQLILK
jgi:hypothetical protein